MIAAIVRACILFNIFTKRANKYYVDNRVLCGSPKNIYINTIDDYIIGAYLYEPKVINTDTKYYIVCHGSGGDRVGHTLNLKLQVVSYTTNSVYLVIDYRGFGDSDGKFTVDGVNLDILAAYNYLKDMYDNDNISIIGFSLGAVIATEYCKFAKLNYPSSLPNKCFSLAPFTTPVEIARYHSATYRWMANKFKSIDKKLQKSLNYNSVDSGAKICDILYLFDGTKDNIVPQSLTKKVSNASQCYTETWDSNHIMLFLNHDIWRKIDKLNNKDCSDCFIYN